MDQQTQDNSKPKRNPYCSRCRNHGKSAQVKGHKRHCEYRDCQCEGCKLVECRQLVSAAQIKRRRYQKQDEECGRRIEISPPVLKREPNNDPAALIAKTLIGSSSTKHLQHHQHQQLAHKQSMNELPLHHQHPHQLHAHLPAIHSASAAATLAAAAASAASSASSSVDATSNLHQQPNWDCYYDDDSNHDNNNHHHLQHGAHLNFNLNHHHNSHQTGSPANSALTDAFRLFRFPNPMLSAAAAASLNSHGHSGSASGTSIAALPTFPTAITNTPTPLPSYRDQISLVEEFHQNFGPLAVYAWFRAEQFNFQKIRDLIEVSRVAFDELLELTGHSPLDLTSPIVD